MNAENYNVSAIYLRGYLAALRRVSGNQYVRLIKQGGLEQYADKYPPPSLEVVAKGGQLIAVDRAVLLTIGRELADLFQRNLSREFARDFCAIPGNKEEFAQILQAATSTQQLMLEVSLRLSTKIKRYMSEDISVQSGPNQDTIILTYRDSIYCAHLDKAEQPACVSVVIYWKEALLQLTGKRFQIKEVLCSKVSGGRDCNFLIH